MKRPAFGITALLIGIVAWSCTILAYHVLEEPRPTRQTTVSFEFKGLEFSKQWKSPPPEPDLKSLLQPYPVRLAGICLGVVAVVLSAASWVRREGIWLGLAAFTFAVAALAWIWFVVVFVLLLYSGGLFHFLPRGGKDSGEPSDRIEQAAV